MPGSSVLLRGIRTSATCGGGHRKMVQFGNSKKLAKVKIVKIDAMSRLVFLDIIDTSLSSPMDQP
jgi:hypothetical protein